MEKAGRGLTQKAEMYLTENPGFPINNVAREPRW